MTFNNERQRSGLTGVGAPLLVGPPAAHLPSPRLSVPLVALVAGLVEALAVLLGGPAVCARTAAPCSATRQVGNRPHRRTVLQRLSDGSLELLLRGPNAGHRGADLAGMRLARSFVV